MFPTSTQLKYWTFSGTSELNRLRIEANQQFVEKYGREYDVRIIYNRIFVLKADINFCSVSHICVHFALIHIEIN